MLAPLVQEVLEGRAMLTPQQRQRLADFMADANPEQAQLVHDSVSVQRLSVVPCSDK